MMPAGNWKVSSPINMSHDIDKLIGRLRACKKIRPAKDEWSRKKKLFVCISIVFLDLDWPFFQEHDFPSGEKWLDLPPLPTSTTVHPSPLSLGSPKFGFILAFPQQRLLTLLPDSSISGGSDRCWKGRRIKQTPGSLNQASFRGPRMCVVDVRDFNVDMITHPTQVLYEPPMTRWQC